MSVVAKRLVSKKKLRFQQDGFDLDLSYITERIIAMGFPSEGREGIYRNNMKDVQAFFKKYHEGHFKVYNLCSEREYASDVFAGQGGLTARCPFDDHNACPLQLIMALCSDAKQFLDADEKNVVAIHCKAGKGRTGLMVCCLLLFMGIQESANEALSFYAKQRTKNSKGVTIPSQIRYVHYFASYYQHLYLTKREQEYKIGANGCTTPILTSFVLAPKADFDVGGGCEPYFLIHDASDVLIYSSKEKQKPVTWKGQPSHTINCEIWLRQDVRITFYDKDTMSKDDKMFSFWLNPFFLPSSGHLTFKKNELDKAVKDKKNEHFPSDFTCTVYFRDPTELADTLVVPGLHSAVDVSNDDDDDDDDEDEDEDEDEKKEQ